MNKYMLMVVLMYTGPICSLALQLYYMVHRWSRLRSRLLANSVSEAVERLVYTVLSLVFREVIRSGSPLVHTGLQRRRGGAGLLPSPFPVSLAVA